MAHSFSIWGYLIVLNSLCYPLCAIFPLPSSLSFHKEYVSLRGVILSGSAVAAALQAGEGEHTPTLRCATEWLSFQLPTPAELWWKRVGGQ